MIADIPLQELPWLQGFFSGPNMLSWEDILSGNAPPQWLNQVKPWLEFIDKIHEGYPVILTKFSSDGPCGWYGVSANERFKAQMIDEVNSFLVPAYAEIFNPIPQRSTQDEMESVLTTRFGSCVIHFKAFSGNDIPRIEELLSIYRGVLSRRPPIPDRTQRPFGTIRGDFDRALVAGDETRSKALLDELISTGRLSAEQHKCLEVRLLAGLGEWETIARAHDIIPTLMNLPLPPQTIADMTEALYRTYIIEIEKDNDPSALISKFRDSISREFGLLFQERKGIRQPIPLRAFLLFELSQDEPNLARCEAIVKAYPENAEGFGLVQSWVSSIGRSVEAETNLFDDVQQAILDEEYEVGMELCFESLPESWAYKSLLRCGVEIGSTDIATRIVEVIQSAGSHILKGFNSKDSNRFKKLQEQAQRDDRIPFDSDWVTWASWVVGGNCEKDPLEVLERSTVKWSVYDYAKKPDTCSELARLIGNASGESEEVFRTAFPHLVDFFAERSKDPIRAFGPLYSVLIKVIALSSPCNSTELELASSLSEALLRVGPNQESYNELIEDLAEILADNDSSLNLDWALNISELLVLYPSQNKEKRLQFFMNVIGMVKRHLHRITDIHRSIIQLLAQDYGCFELLDSFPARQEETVSFTSENKEYSGLIGLYTLTISAGQRAKKILEQLFPLAKVELNEDHVTTPSLINLAKNADIFVFASRSAKHQAYYGIKKIRDPREVLMPLGKGTASLVREVLDHISRLSKPNVIGV